MAEMTALVIVSPRRIPPWGDRRWTGRHLMSPWSSRLVEGHIPVWKLTRLVDTPGGNVKHPSAHHVHVYPSGRGDTAADLVVAIAAFCLDDPDAVAAFDVAPSWGRLRAVRGESGWPEAHLSIQATPVAPHSTTLVLASAVVVRRVVRLGVVVLAPRPALTPEDCRRLCDFGIDVEVFSSSGSCNDKDS